MSLEPFPDNVFSERKAPSADLVDEDTGQVKKDSMVTFEKAYEMFKNFLNDNKRRNAKNAAIQRKRDGEQPFNPKKLKAAGQDWRNNRPTFWMSTMLRRLAPPYRQMIDQLTYLTYTHFPNENIGTEADADKFRKAITDTIRDDKGNADRNDQIIDEMTSFGYCAAVRFDESKWRSEILRGDEVFFPVGCPQDVDKLESFGVKKNIPVHKVVELLKNPLAAQAAGWNIPKLITKLNNAPEEFRDPSSEDNLRVYQDLIRENNVSASFTSSRKVVKTGQIFCFSPEGKINHYIFDRDDGTPLYFKRNKFSKFSDFISLFSMEIGDRTLQGSKGAGRALFNAHVSIEQARNLIQDGLHLNGLLLLKKKSVQGSGTLETPTLRVMHPFAVIGDDYEALDKVSFNMDVDAFMTLDQHATTQAEIQLGIFMPGVASAQQGGEKATASEINYVASIDAQIRANTLSRFARQYFDFVGMMSSAICHPEVVKFAKAMKEQIEAQTEQGGKDLTVIHDPGLWSKLERSGFTENFLYIPIPIYLEEDAVKAVYQLLLDGLSPEQIIVLANCSPRANVDDAISAQSGVLDMIVSRYAADPIIDTVELKRRDISSKLGADAAARLMKVDESPLSDINQQRIQISELSNMLVGSEVPVDASDNDLLHLDVIAQRLAPMLQNPSILPLTSSQVFIQNVLGHAKAHISSAMGKGVKQSDLSSSIQAVNALEQLVAQPPLDQQIQSTIDAGAIPADVGAVSDPSMAPAPTAADLVNDPTALTETSPISPAPTVLSTAAPERPSIPRGPVPAV